MAGKLSLGAKNSLVTEFNSRIDSLSQESSEATEEFLVQDDKTKSIEFTKEIYDKAISLPEAQNVSLPKNDDLGKGTYGEFVGGNTFSDFNGSLNKDSTPSKKGWVTVDKSSPYLLFTTYQDNYIISSSSFIPQSTVNDFGPLDAKINSELHSKDSVYDDTNSTTSLGTTYKDFVSNAINIEGKTPEDARIGLKEDKSSFAIANGALNPQSNLNIGTLEEASKGNKDFIFDSKTIVEDTEPSQIKSSDISPNESGENSYNGAQVIIYDIPSEGTSTKSRKLVCYQQPDSINYAATASYDTQSPRGAQQPFLFYQNANAITMAFSLKFHIDEARGYDRTFGDAKNLQEVAQISEEFTRPWKVGDSIRPKLVKVILPGITRIGYLSEASVTYTGSMTGDIIEGTTTRSLNETGTNLPSSYYYNQIEVTYSLYVISDDIILRELSPEESIVPEHEYSYNLNDQGNEQLTDIEGGMQNIDGKLSVVDPVTNKSSPTASFPPSISKPEQSNLQKTAEAVANSYASPQLSPYVYSLVAPFITL